MTKEDKKDTDSEFKPDPTRSMAIARAMGEYLAGEHPAIQGAAIAETLGVYLAGHLPKFREKIIENMVATAIKISLIESAHMHDDTEH